MWDDVIALEGGFADPVLDAQSVFRAVMDAMARPATVHGVGRLANAPAPLDTGAAAIACALIDADTPFWLDAALATDAIRAWLAFQTGARATALPAEAAFAFGGEPAAMPALDRFALGTQEYPDRSATLVLQVPALEGGPALAFEGPGIKERAIIAPRGLPEDFAAQWRVNTARFPRGVDVILACGDRIACLPRTARLAAPEA